MYNLLLDKEFWTHITSYQAQINPEKVDEHFKKFKVAFYPHIEEYQEREKKARQKHMVESMEKGTLLKFRPETTSARKINSFTKQVANSQNLLQERFNPTPRRR